MRALQRHRIWNADKRASTGKNSKSHDDAQSDLLLQRDVEVPQYEDGEYTKRPIDDGADG